MAEPKIYKAKIEDFKPDPRNANKHTQRGLRVVENSMRKRGYARPAFAANDGTIIGGNLSTGEVAPSIGLGDGEVLVVETDGDIPIIHKRRDVEAGSEEARLLGLEDNRSAELSLDWDVEVISEDKAEGLDLSELWNAEELAELLGEEEPKGEDPGAQVDKAEELREKWGVESGQLWQCGEHQMICGDCTDRSVVERVMGGEKAQAVVTDPPYGQNQKGVPEDEPEKLAGIVRSAVSALPVENTIVVAFQSPRTFTEWLDAIREAGHKFERMLWLYKAARCTFPWRGWI